MRDAAAYAGFGARTAEKRGAVKLPRSYTGRPWGSGSGRIADRQKRTGETRAPKRNRSPVRAACVRPPSGDDPHQIHSLLLKAVLYDLKRLAPAFDADAEQMRTQREIVAGDRPADIRDYPFPRDTPQRLGLPRV